MRNLSQTEQEISKNNLLGNQMSSGTIQDIMMVAPTTQMTADDIFDVIVIDDDDDDDESLTNSSPCSPALLRTSNSSCDLNYLETLSDIEELALGDSCISEDDQQRVLGVSSQEKQISQGHGSCLLIGADEEKDSLKSSQGVISQKVQDIENDTNEQESIINKQEGGDKVEEKFDSPVDSSLEVVHDDVDCMINSDLEDELEVINLDSEDEVDDDDDDDNILMNQFDVSLESICSTANETCVIPFSNKPVYTDNEKLSTNSLLQHTPSSSSNEFSSKDDFQSSSNGTCSVVTHTGNGENVDTNFRRLPQTAQDVSPISRLSAKQSKDNGEEWFDSSMDSNLQVIHDHFDSVINSDSEGDLEVISLDSEVEVEDEIITNKLDESLESICSTAHETCEILFPNKPVHTQNENQSTNSFLQPSSSSCNEFSSNDDFPSSSIGTSSVATHTVNVENVDTNFCRLPQTAQDVSLISANQSKENSLHLCDDFINLATSSNSTMSDCRATSRSLNDSSNNSLADAEIDDVIVIDDSDSSSSSSDDYSISSGRWLNTQPSANELSFMETSGITGSVERELTQTAEDSCTSVARKLFNEPSGSQQPASQHIDPNNMLFSQGKRKMRCKNKVQYQRPLTPENFWTIGVPDSETGERRAQDDSAAVRSLRRRKPLLKKFKSLTEEKEEKMQEEARRKQEEEEKMQEEARRKQEEEEKMQKEARRKQEEEKMQEEARKKQEEEEKMQEEARRKQEEEEKIQKKARKKQEEEEKMQKEARKKQ